MNTKKIVKRLSAVGAGAVMLGATVMGAFAADLSSYPDMFVSDGTFNGYLVVGESASPIDNLAMTDVATSMYFTSGDSSSTTTVEGDAWLAATSSNFLELGEDIANVESYLDDSMLGALVDGEVSNAKGVAEYEQFLYVDENDATTSFQEDDDDNIGFFYKVNSGSVIARYVMDFTSNLESDVDSNSDFDDIEDEVISVLGMEYTITEATNESGSTKLVLMGGAVSDTLEEGDVATYDIDGTEYQVELLSVTATEAQFSINGETTSKLQDSETDVLDDGVTNIGVTDITYQDYAGGIHSASFFLGADKIELTDGSNMKVNEETINDAAVIITETYSGGDVAISELYVNMTAEDDLYVGEGMKLSEADDLDEPQVMFTQNWDMELSEVYTGTMEELSLTFSESDGQADLTVELADGEVAIPLVYLNSTTDLIGGEKDSEFLRYVQEEMIEKGDYFFLSTASPTSATADAKSYFLQYKGSDATGDSSPKTYVKNMATGETLENSLGSDGTSDLRLGGVTFTLANNTASVSSTTDDFNINITSLGGGATGITDAGEARSVFFRTADNHEVEIRDENVTVGTDGDTSDWNVVVTVDDTDKLDDTGDEPFVVLNATISDSSSELATSTGTVSNDGTAYSGVSDPDDSDITYFRSNYGDYLVSTATSGSPTKYELSVPETQAEVMLYVTSGATTSTSSVSGDLELVTVVDATRLDSEVADVSAQNLIVVGGPCVNTVAAELMGNPSDCSEGFTPGVSMVKLFENGDSVAMLVAGYSGTDTRLAGRVVANRWDELSGESVEIEGSTYSDASISEASEAAEEEEESSEE